MGEKAEEKRKHKEEEKKKKAEKAKATKVAQDKEKSEEDRKKQLEENARIKQEKENEATQHVQCKQFVTIRTEQIAQYDKINPEGIHEALLAAMTPELKTAMANTQDMEVDNHEERLDVCATLMA